MIDCVHIVRRGSLKPFWGSQLQELKEASIETYK